MLNDGLYDNMMASKRYLHFMLGIILLGAGSCTQAEKAREEVSVEPVADTVSVTEPEVALLWTDAQLEQEALMVRQSEELFDDFLYNYIHDTVLQRERAVFPLSEVLADGSTREISQEDWNEDYYFAVADYTTALYNSVAEMSLNEDTALWRASVEKIDLEGENITAYDFIRYNDHWNLVTIRNQSFVDSDLRDFLSFYARFANDVAFRNTALSKSIHVSIMDPENDTQNIDGFISREQWPTICSVVPEGVIMNIRYGQQYKHSKRILMEKTSMGDGMSEVFSFAKGSRGWELVGYEN